MCVCLHTAKAFVKRVPQNFCMDGIDQWMMLAVEDGFRSGSDLRIKDVEIQRLNGSGEGSTLAECAVGTLQPFEIQPGQWISRLLASVINVSAPVALRSVIVNHQ